MFTFRVTLIAGACCCLAISVKPARSADHDADILYRQARMTVDADSAAALYKQVVEMFPRDSAAAWSMLRLAQYAAAHNDQVAMEDQVIRLRELFPLSAARKESSALLPERRDEPIPKVTVQKHKQTPPPSVASTKPTPPSNAVPAPSPSTRVNSSFAVQLGAFSVKANAERMKQLATSTAPAEIIERPRSNGTLYIVIAGKYGTAVEAQAALLELEKSTSVHGVVITH